MKAALSSNLAACETTGAVFGCAAAYCRSLGVSAIMIHNYREFAEHSDWRPLYSSFPRTLVDAYTAHQGLKRDPIMRAALQASTPVRAWDVLRSRIDCPTLKRMFGMCAEAGIVDGLSMVVMSRPGSFNYVGLAFPHSLAAMSTAERCRIQRDVEMIARRLSALAPTPSRKGLSPKEIEVFARMASGASNKEIARDLGVAPTTVETLMSRSLHKLKAKSRIEAAVKAAREGLLVAA